MKESSTSALLPPLPWQVGTTPGSHHEFVTVEDAKGKMIVNCGVDGPINRAKAEAIAEWSQSAAQQIEPAIILDADKCSHEAFRVDLEVDRIEDVEPIGFYANIRIRCTECETAFHFIGLPYGLSPSEPRLEVGGLECRMPIGPGRLPIGDFGEARYEIGRRRK